MTFPTAAAMITVRKFCGTCAAMVPLLFWRVTRGLFTACDHSSGRRQSLLGETRLGESLGVATKAEQLRSRADAQLSHATRAARLNRLAREHARARRHTL